MRSGAGFGLCLLAAGAIHAVVLTVPRIGAERDAPIPTVEIDLAGPSAPLARATFMPASAAPARSPTGPAVLPAPVPRPLRGPEQPPSAAQTESPLQRAPVTNLPEQEPKTDPGRPQEATRDVEPDLGPTAASMARGPELSDEGPGATAAAAAPAPISGEVASGGHGADDSGNQAAAGRNGTAPGGDGPLKSPNLVPPRPARAILPAYPVSARQSGAQGLVKVAVVVEESGAVSHAEILSSSGSALLDQAALEAVRHATFEPARLGDVPTRCRLVIPIRFQLSGASR